MTGLHVSLCRPVVTQARDKPYCPLGSTNRSTGTERLTEPDDTVDKSVAYSFSFSVRLSLLFVFLSSLPALIWVSVFVCLRFVRSRYRHARSHFLHTGINSVSRRVDKAQKFKMAADGSSLAKSLWMSLQLRVWFCSGNLVCSALFCVCAAGNRHKTESMFFVILHSSLLTRISRYFWRCLLGTVL